MEIFKLFGSIFVNTDAADESMQKTESKAKKIASAFGNGVKTAAKWGAAVVSAAAVAGTAIFGMAANVAETTDRIDKMSQKIGVSREAYQELDFICSQSGMSVDSLQGGIKKLTDQMQAARDGTKSAVKAFDELGVSIYDSNGALKDQETMMWEALDALQKMENQTEKAALANDLFGKSGSELMPMLNGAAGSIEEMKNQAHELGLVLSDDTVNAGVKLTDAIDQIKRSFSAIGTNLAASVVPIVLQFADIVLENLPMIQQAIASFAPLLADMAGSVLPPLMQLVSEIFPILIELVNQLIPPVTQFISVLLPVITNLILSILPPLMQIIEAVLPLLTTLIDALTPILQLVIELLNPIIQLFTNLLAPIITVIAEALAPLIEIIGLLMESGLKPLIDVVKIVGEIFSGVLANVFTSCKGVIDNIIGVFRGLATFLKGIFTGDFKLAFQGIVDIVSNIFGGIVEFVKLPINLIIGLLNGFIDGINKIKVPDWVPLVGGKGINIPKIPMLRNGGNVIDPGRVLVGEDGPEFLDLPAGARVTPLDKVSGEIDYQLLKDLIIEAILNAVSKLDLAVLIQLMLDDRGVLDIVRKEMIRNSETGRPEAVDYV